MTIKYFCDRCGKQVKYEKNLIRLFPEYGDLCKKCYKKFKKLGKKVKKYSHKLNKEFMKN